MTLDTRIAHAEGMQQNAERLLAEAEQKIVRQAAVIRNLTADVQTWKRRYVRALEVAEGNAHWAEKLQAELDRLHSWDGLMELLAKHWPEDLIPTMPDSDERDPGPRIVSLIRWVDWLRAGLTTGRR